MLFLSHNTQDDDFVLELQRALGASGQDVWIDSREVRGGDALPSTIKKAIEDASAFAVVVSRDSWGSSWVSKELRHALKMQKERGSEQYRIIPLLLDGTGLGAFEGYFDEEPVCILVSSDADGVEAAVDDILVALGTRDPADMRAERQPKPEPLEELVLELSDLKFHDQNGVRRASARARLIHQPAASGQSPVESNRKWRFVAPLGPIEIEELRWYLEKYAIWPSDHFRDRAQKVEENLVRWGELLHEAAFPAAQTENVLQSWTEIDSAAGRRFSVHVDAALEDGAAAADVDAARECATLLLSLPWELLHDGKTFVFQAEKPTRVRRRLPNTRSLKVPVVATPIRILLVPARPEDEACSYIDHRASALPLVEAMETLSGLVSIRILEPPTLDALRQELDRAGGAGEPYHVVHFDGHGAYDRRAGLGGLCFEEPQDADQLEKRRHIVVSAADLEPSLRDHRIPLVFLDACQTALAAQASESVASELLQVGVASVVAMSHSVLVATAKRFVEEFYGALAGGARVGAAMLQGQRALHADPFRGRVFGAGELRLQDWFVPVLFQEKEDPQLFRTRPTSRTREEEQRRLKASLGELPDEPETGFVGRSRELLALQRLLRDGKARYAVLRGQGGEGKTALAAEFARWMVRSQQIRRAAFVSVEMHSNVDAVLDAIGHQLVPGYSVATFEDPEKAILPVERALVEQPTLLVVDNLESILAFEEADAILALCARLLANGETRIIFTSREALPAPFDGERNRRELYRLDREDAVRLVERALTREGGGAGAASDTAREEIEQLVDAVHGHARTLALLGPSLRERGVEATRVSLVELMEEMERTFPGEREKSLFASVELSLRRMSPENRERARVLAVFHGCFQLDVLRIMMEWKDEDVAALAGELIETGLATADPYAHLTLNPALCPYLLGRMEAAERESLAACWVEAMGRYVAFLDQQRRQKTEMAAALTVLELPNLMALLAAVQNTQDAEATIGLATSLYGLLKELGRPRLLEQVAQARDLAAQVLGAGWSRAAFNARGTSIEQQLGGGHLREALEDARTLLRHAREAGETAYTGADYDLAMACWLLARVLERGGGSEKALPLLDEAQGRFEEIDGSPAAERMASICVGDRGDCLADLGRLDEAASAYEEAIRRAERRGGEREVAVGKGQLGTVRLRQRRYQDALQAYKEAREHFTSLDEPGSVAVIWHQIGMGCQKAGQPEAAEDAYRKSLAIKVQLGDVAGQAGTLNQLGNLYDDLGRSEEAVIFFRQAADRYVASGDEANEGRVRNNLANTLRKLRRLDEARQEIRRAITCKEPFGHASAPWTTCAILAGIETDAGDPLAAAEAKRKAVACYLAYRRDGGENHYGDGRIALAVIQALLAGDSTAAASFLQQVAADPDLAASLRPFIEALQAIIAGSRDRALADDSDLDYTMAAEILFLIETLEKHAG